MGDGFGEGRHDLAIGGLALAEGEFEAEFVVCAAAGADVNEAYAAKAYGARSQVVAPDTEIRCLGGLEGVATVGQTA